MEAYFVEWCERIIAATDAVAAMGGETEELVIAPPAVEEEIEQIERELGRQLPASFRSVLLTQAGGMSAYWHLPDDEEDEEALYETLPEELQDIFSCTLSFSLPQLARYEQERKGWVEDVFSDPEDSYDAVWHNKLAFMKVRNSDYLAFDLSVDGDCPVVYLSHDGGEGHGYVLGKSFKSFMEQWTLLGCPGNEDWQMLPFLADDKNGIEANSDAGKQFREWLGVAK